MECVWASLRNMDSQSRKAKRKPASDNPANALARLEEYLSLSPTSNTSNTPNTVDEVWTSRSESPKNSSSPANSGEAEICVNSPEIGRRKTSLSWSSVEINRSDIDGNSSNAELVSLSSAELKKFQFQLRWNQDRKKEHFSKPKVELNVSLQTSPFSAKEKELTQCANVNLTAGQDYPVNSEESVFKVQMQSDIASTSQKAQSEISDALGSNIPFANGAYAPGALTELDVPKEEPIIIKLNTEPHTLENSIGGQKGHRPDNMEEENVSSFGNEIKELKGKIEQCILHIQQVSSESTETIASGSISTVLSLCGKGQELQNDNKSKEKSQLALSKSMIDDSIAHQDTSNNVINVGLTPQENYTKITHPIMPLTSDELGDHQNKSEFSKKIKQNANISRLNTPGVSKTNLKVLPVIKENDVSKNIPSTPPKVEGKNVRKSQVILNQLQLKEFGQEVGHKDIEVAVEPVNFTPDYQRSVTIIVKAAEMTSHPVTASNAREGGYAEDGLRYPDGTTRDMSELEGPEAIDRVKNPVLIEDNPMTQVFKQTGEEIKEIKTCDEICNVGDMFSPKNIQNLEVCSESESLSEMKLETVYKRALRGMSNNNASSLEVENGENSGNETSRRVSCEFEGFMYSKDSAGKSPSYAEPPASVATSEVLKNGSPIIVEDSSFSLMRREKADTSESQLSDQVNMISLLTISGALGTKKKLLIVPRSYLTVELVMAAVNIGKFDYKDIYTWICKILRPNDRKFREINRLQFNQYEKLSKIMFENVDATVMAEWNDVLRKTPYRLPKGRGWSLIFETVPDFCQDVKECDTVVPHNKQQKCIASTKKTKYDKSELKVSTLLKKIEVKSKHVKALKQQQATAHKEMQVLRGEIKKHINNMKIFLKKHSGKDSSFETNLPESSGTTELWKVLSHICEIVLEKDVTCFDLQQKITDLSGVIEEKEQTIKQKNELILKMEAKIGLPFANRNEKKLREQELHIKHLQDKLRKAKESANYKEVSNIHLKEEVRTHLLLLGEKDQIITKNWEKISELENTIESCKSMRNQLDQKLHGVKCAMRERDVYIRSMEEQYYSMKQELDKSAFTLQEKMSIIQQQQSLLDQHKESYDWSMYQNSYNASNKEKEQQEQHLAELETRLRDYYNTIMEKEEMIKQLQKEVFDTQATAKEKEQTPQPKTAGQRICRKCSKFDDQCSKPNTHSAHLLMMQKKIKANSDLIAWKDDQLQNARKKVQELQGEVEYLLEKSKAGISSCKDLREVYELKKKNSSLQQSVIAREDMNAQLEEKLKIHIEELEYCTQKLQSKSTVVELLQNYIVDKERKLTNVKCDAEGPAMNTDDQVTPNKISGKLEEGIVIYSKLPTNTKSSFSNTELGNCDNLLRETVSPTENVLQGNINISNEELLLQNGKETAAGSMEDTIVEHQTSSNINETNKFNSRDPRLQIEQGKSTKSFDLASCSWTNSFEETESKPLKITFAEYWKRKGSSTSSVDCIEGPLSVNTKEQENYTNANVSRESKKRLGLTNVEEYERTDGNESKRCRIEFKLMQGKTEIEKKPHTFCDKVPEGKETATICKKVADSKNPWEEIKRLRKIIDALKSKNDKDMAKQIKECLKLQAASEKREAVLVQVLEDMQKLKMQLKESDLALTVTEKERERVNQLLCKSETSVEAAIKAKEKIEIQLEENKSSLLETQKEVEKLQVNLQRSNETSEKEIATYKNDVSLLETELKQVNRSLVENEDSHKKALDLTNRKINRMQKALEECQCEKNQLCENIRNREEMLISVQATLNQITTLGQHQLKGNVQNDLEEMVAISNRDECSRDKSEASVHNLEERNMSLKGIENNITSQLMIIRETISNYQQEKESESEKVKELETERQSLQDSLGTTEQKLEEIIEENTQKDLQIESLKKSSGSEIQSLKMSLDEIQKQLKLKEQEVEALIKAHKKLESELESNKSKHLSEMLERESFLKLQLNSAQDSIEELQAAKSFLAQQLQGLDITKEQMRKELNLEIQNQKVWNLDQELAKVCDLNKMLCDEKQKSQLVSHHWTAEKNRNKNLVKQLQRFKKEKKTKSTPVIISRESQTSHSFEEEQTIMENSRNLQTALEAEKQVSEDYYKELILERRKTTFLNDCLKQEYAESSKDIEYLLTCISWATDRYRTRMSHRQELSSTIEEFTGNVGNS